MRARRGFTLIELMVVVAILAVVAAISVPNLVSARVTANETTAMATLRMLATAQAQNQAGGYVDADDDGTGEYGFFRELSGAHGVRVTGDGSNVGELIDPPIISGAFRNISPTGTVSRSGYVYRIVLPSASGAAIEERPAGVFAGGSVDANLAETTWCALAWPVNYRTTGNRSFFVSQTGDVLATEDAAYSGPAPGYYAGSAFLAPGSVSSCTGELAIGTVGRDGNRWKRVN